MTGRRRSIWGGLAVSAAKAEAVELRPFVIAWPEPDPTKPEAVRLLAVLDVAPAGRMYGRRICEKAGMNSKPGRRALGRLAATGRIESNSVERSVLDRTWRLTPEGRTYLDEQNR